MCFEKAVEAKPKAHDTGTLFDIRMIRMREIKFRVWDNVDYMSKPFTLYELQAGLIQIDSVCPVMQFTGFKDSKGQDIYEGDIVYVAGFSHRAKVIITHAHGTEFEDITGHHRSAINAAAESNIGRILGNIHQNPELLEGDK